MTKCVTKCVGDLAVNCVIGELSKYGLGIAFPLSDNYPFDLIVISNNKLFRLQVKSSSTIINGSIIFHNARTKKNNDNENYTNEEIDAFALYNLVNKEIYILSFNETKNKGGIVIRLRETKNNQKGGIYSYNLVTSNKRIKEVFGFEAIDFSETFSKYEPFKHIIKCIVCNKEFKSTLKNTKYCSDECYGFAIRKVEKPALETLKDDINKMPMVHIGKKYGVSNTTIKKWAISYGIL